MIGKVITGSFVGGLLNYLERETSEIIDKNMFGETIPELTNEFLMMSELNPRVERNVKHMMLSFAHTDELNKDQIRSLAREYLQEVGYNNNQYVCFQHNDTDHLHVHFVVNKIDFEGKNTHIPFEKRKSREVIMTLERKYDLHRTALVSKDNENFYDRNYEELKERLNSKGQETDKQRLESAVKKTLMHSKSLTEFVLELEKQGIVTEINSANNGISFESEGMKIKGSSLDRKLLSYTGVMEQIAKNNQSPELDIKRDKSNILVERHDKEKDQEPSKGRTSPGGKTDNMDGAEEERLRRLKRNRKRSR